MQDRSVTGWCSLVGVALLAAAAGTPANAEQARVDGMGRTHGWVVATEGGDLGFVDCQGRRSPLGGARVEPATGRCPTAPSPLDVSGIVVSVDPARRIVQAEDGTGRLRVFHVTDDVARLEQLKAGERIQVTGPIDGQATRITRP